MPNKGGVYYMCVENVSKNAERLSEGFSFYKFSVAITEDGIIKSELKVAVDRRLAVVDTRSRSWLVRSPHAREVSIK